MKILEEMTAGELADEFSRAYTAWLQVQVEKVELSEARRAFSAEFLAALSDQSRNELFFQAMPNPIDTPDGEQINKRAWLDIAELIGPDHAQLLYHGAVFATKVA